jgi:sigma-B regulation protein RsbU (phosphoserine phosphatase)
MKFRWKLLLLLMSVSILPIVGLRTYGIHNVRLMADALVQKLEQVQKPADSNTAVPPLIQGPDSGRVQALQDQLTKDGVLELKQNILERVERVETLTLCFLSLLIILITLCGLIFSRSVIRKIESIAKAARKLANGDFEAKTGIVSHDEFGEIGKIFDGIGPKLKDHYRMLQSISVAMEIQQRLLPSAPPQAPGFDIDAMTLYSDETGGDYFDYLCSGANQKLCLVVGDVTDHGLPSALLMASVRGMLRLRAAMPGVLEDMVSDVNRQYARDVEAEGRFMTLFLARIDRENQLLEWVRAGHDPAILYDAAEDSFTDLKGQGTALGISADFTFTRQSLPIRPGQVICLFTDGIPETRNSQGVFFGRERLRQVIRQHAAETAKTMMLSILDAVAEFRGDREQEDDLTLMVVKI